MKESLTAKETEALDNIRKDLALLFDKEEILPGEIDEVMEGLSSEEVKRYVTYLKEGSKPEIALREALLSGGSVLGKYLFGELSPEVNIGEGFIDYLIKVDRNRIILLELKPLFESHFETSKGQRILKNIKQINLDWNFHKSQIEKYVQGKNSEFIILTNLKLWHFFSRISIKTEGKPFFTANLTEFNDDYAVIGNLTDYLERRESQYHKEGLDKKFFESLREWVKIISSVKFNVDDKVKMELVVSLINKLIFVQTLDDYGIIDFRWLETTWNHHVQRWGAKGRLKVLQEFFKELDSWFFEYYDTELFKVKNMTYLDLSDKNVDKFYESLESVIGLTAWQKILGGNRGISQYKFKYIDEDIFGKAYETFLAEIRKERGIYYTPKVITKYVVDNTVSHVFEAIAEKLCNELMKDNFEEAEKLAKEFISIKVLDSSCGSGSFLIKALRSIWQEYVDLQNNISKIHNKYAEYRPTESKKDTSLFLPEEIVAKIDQCNNLKKILGFCNTNYRELISKVILRHIYGNDLDKNAIDVAKVNIWLEAIKLSPHQFKYDSLPPETNHILPDLETNLGHGDSLVGLPEEYALDFLTKNYQKELAELSALRNRYLDDPKAIEYVEKIEEIKVKIRIGLNEEFKNYLKINSLLGESLENILAFHWPLEFWFFYFTEDGRPLVDDSRGVNVLIGNPPYVDYRSVEPLCVHEFFKKVYESSKVAEKYNLYILFIEKGLQLLKKNGKFSYINPLQWMGSLMGTKLREWLLNTYNIAEIDDLSLLSVFEEPTLSNLGLFFIDKNKQKDKIKIGYRIPTSTHISENKIEFAVTNINNLIMGPEKVIMLDPNIRVNNLIKALEKNPKLLDVAELEWGTSQSGYGTRKISLQEYEKMSASKKKDYMPLVQTGDLIRHDLIWQGEYIDKSIYSNVRVEQFSHPKLIFSRRAPSIECVYDEKGFYLGKVAFSTNFKVKTDPYFLVGLLNSRLMDFYFKKVYETIHPGGNLRLDIPYLNQLPIKMPSSTKHKNLTRKISDQTRKIIELKTAYHEYLKIWENGFKRFNKIDKTLFDLLNNDADLIKRGKLNDCWTSKVSFYPSRTERNSDAYSSIILMVDSKKPIIRIYGLSHTRSSDPIYEIEFGSEDSMQHIFIALVCALRSGVRIKSLDELFKKTPVPLISMDLKSTQNIFEKIRKEFIDFLKDRKMTTIKPNIAWIFNQIQKLDSDINEFVYELYSLTDDDRKIIDES